MPCSVPSWPACCSDGEQHRTGLDVFWILTLQTAQCFPDERAQVSERELEVQWVDGGG